MRLAPTAVLALAAVSAAFATPWYTQDPRTLKEGKWRVEEHVFSTSIDSALADGEKVPLPTATDASSLTLLTRIRYGVRDNVTVFADIPWVSKRVHFRDSTFRDNDGLGDLFFLAKWKYHDSRQTKTRRSLALSVKTGTGEFRGLPALLATGTGGTNWNFTHLWEKQVGRTTWYGNLTYSLTGRNKDTSMDPGDLVLANIAAEHNFANRWNFVWEINGRYQGHFVKPGNAHLLGSSTVVALTPGFQYTRLRPGGQTTFEAGVQIPVVKKGDQPAIANHEVYVGAYAIF